MKEEWSEESEDCNIYEKRKELDEILKKLNRLKKDRER